MRIKFRAYQLPVKTSGCDYIVPFGKNNEKKAAAKCGLPLKSSVDAYLVARLGVDQILDITDDEVETIRFAAECAVTDFSSQQLE